jgi:hypothetical protein
VVRRKSAIGTGGTVTVIVRTTGPMATTPTIGPITMVGVPALAFGVVSRLTEHYFDVDYLKTASARFLFCAE